MKSIGLNDNTGKEIVEGDTLELFMTENQQGEYYKFLGVDKVICHVLENTGNIGAIVSEEYFSNNKRVGTFQQELDFLLESEYKLENGELLTKEKYLEEYLPDGSTLDDFQTIKNYSVYSSVNFAHSFIHIDKRIVKEGLQGEERDSVLNNKNKLMLELSDGTKIDPSEELLIELSKEMIELVTENSLIMYSKEDDMVVGDFTHLKLKTKSYNKYEHQYDVLGCNEKGEVTYFYHTDKVDEQNMEINKFREVLMNKKASMIESGIDEKEVSKSIIKEFNLKKAEIKSSLEFKTKTDFPIFISLTSSVDVLDCLIKNGSKIIKEKVKPTKRLKLR